MAKSLLCITALFLLMSNDEACFPTVPVTDLATTRTTVRTTTPSTTTTTTAPCVVGSTPFGTFNPAPGSTISDGSIAILTCDPATHLASTPAILTATCFNGVLSPTTACDPCPDTTWLYDSTTNRCFKAFAAVLPFVVPCDINFVCAPLGIPYGVPSGIGYTPNLPILISAATIGIQNRISNNPSLFDVFNIGVNDPTATFTYQLIDGTPVSASVINPLFLPGQPNDMLFYVIVREPNGVPGGPIGLDDDFCFASHGSVCQLQL